jgi:glycosyltransferase
MKISVITPVFNSGSVIEANLNSVVNQEYSNFEHIIVDSLSSDNSLEIIKNVYQKNNITDKLQIISEKDEGIADAFNKGIKAASGDIINILNSDDYYYSPSVFDEVIDAFKNKSILFIHGDIYFYDPVYGSNIRKPLMCPVQFAMPYNHPTMFIKKSLYDDAGLYDPSFQYAMDFEFICRLYKNMPFLKNKAFYMDKFPAVYMRAGGASWKNEAASLKEIKRALKKNKLWNTNARLNLFSRKIRLIIKSSLKFTGLHSLVVLWRNKKWSY